MRQPRKGNRRDRPRKMPIWGWLFTLAAVVYTLVRMGRLAMVG
jgi:hypothetical protein